MFGWVHNKLLIKRAHVAAKLKWGGPARPKSALNLANLKMEIDSPESRRCVNKMWLTSCCTKCQHRLQSDNGNGSGYKMLRRHSLRHFWLLCIFQLSLWGSFSVFCFFFLGGGGSKHPGSVANYPFHKWQIRPPSSATAAASNEILFQTKWLLAVVIRNKYAARMRPAARFVCQAIRMPPPKDRGGTVIPQMHSVAD